MGQASDNKAEVLNQINLLKQAKTQHQTAIRNLKGQLASAVPNNAMQPAVVTQMQESLNTATPNIDYSAVYSQMTEMNNALSELQNENDALRAENAALRAQNTSQ
jgi:regulator of replication initiation timing